MCAAILGPIIGATMETAGAAVEGAAVAAAETAVTTTGAVAAEATAAVVVDTAAATAVEEAVTLAEATPAIAETQIVDIASGRIFPAEAPRITAPKEDPSFTKEPVLSDNEALGQSQPNTKQDDEDFLNEVTAPLAENDKLSNINEDGELNDEVLEDEAFLENVTSPLAKNDNDDYKNGKNDTYVDGTKKPTIELTQTTAREKNDMLNEQLKKILDDFINKTITEEEKDKLLRQNEKEREDLFQSLVKRLDEQDDTLTPYEKEVATAGAEMRAITNEVAAAPRTFDVMADELKNLKKQYKLVSQTGNSDNPTEITQTTGLLDYYAGKITAQAADMAKYVVSIKRDVNYFQRKNRKVESLIGVNNGFLSVVKAIAYELEYRIEEMNTDTIARTIGQTGKISL